MRNKRDFEQETREFWKEFESDTGWDKTTTIGISGRTVPICAKNCPQCGKPSPMVVIDARFLCRKCLILFV